jgi:predicted phosphodiesterase
MRKNLIISLIIFIVLISGCAKNNHLIKNTNQFSFVIYGDSREGEKHHQNLVTLINDKNPDFIIHTGDMVNDGCNNGQWNKFLTIVKNICRSKDRTVRCDQASNYLDTTYYPAIGNHENINDCSQIYFSVFPFLEKEGTEQRYYSFNYDNSYFIILDSSSNKEIGEQYNWLKNQLKISKNYKFVFISFHHPPYTSGGHSDNEFIKKYWVPLFKEYNVDMVFNGHSHHYARLLIDNINYIITGGGGAPLYDVEEKEFTIYAESIYHYVLITIDNNKLTYEVYDENNYLVESYFIEE